MYHTEGGGRGQSILSSEQCKSSVPLLFTLPRVVLLTMCIFTLTP